MLFENPPGSRPGALVDTGQVDGLVDARGDRDRSAGPAFLALDRTGGVARLEPRRVGGQPDGRCRLVRDGVEQVVEVEALGGRVDECAIGTRGCARAEEQAVAQGVRELKPVAPALEGAERGAAEGIGEWDSIQCVFDGVVRRPVEELGNDVEAVPDAACDSRGDDVGGTEVAGRSVGLTCPKLQTAVSASARFVTARKVLRSSPGTVPRSISMLEPSADALAERNHSVAVN